MVTVYHAVNFSLLLLSISTVSSFQTLVKVQSNHVASKSICSIPKLSQSRNGRYLQPQPLQMGFVEDFLSGADASQREVENDKYIAELQQRVARINALETEIEELGDDELEQKTIELKHRIRQKGEDINGPLLEEAFAVVREAAWYVIDE